MFVQHKMEEAMKAFQLLKQKFEGKPIEEEKEDQIQQK